MTAVKQVDSSAHYVPPVDHLERGGFAWRRVLVTSGVLCALVVTVVFTVMIGPAQLSAGEVWASILHHLGLGGFAGGVEISALRDAMVWELRLPRVLTAGAVGAGLALCGVIMQSLTRNPLADPYLLGLSSGASLGAVIVLLFAVGVALPIAAFSGALLALVGSLTLARSMGAVTPVRTILAGLAISQVCSAGVSFIIFWSASGDSYRQVLAWLMGSLGGASWSTVAIAGGALVVIGVPLMVSGNILDAFTFGEASAHSLGIRVEAWRWGLLIAVAVLTGSLVSVSGAIGFVGIIIPHAVRLLVGTGHRLLLPLSAACGAVFLMWCDTLARTIFDPREIPVGVITAAVGAPLFAFVLYRTKAGEA